jgi:hypothetical protein
MKKFYFSLFVFLFSIFTVYSQTHEPKDLIIVLDTSSSMYNYYHPVTDQIIGPLLNMYLAVGDTFHLITFSSKASNEISKRIEGKGDIETIIARVMLMYPIDPWSDVLSSLDFLHNFLKDLPSNRKKTVLFISDGIHNPPSDSYYVNLTEEDVIRVIESSAQKLKGNDWNFHYLQIPITQTQLNTDNVIAIDTVESTQQLQQNTKTTPTTNSNNGIIEPTSIPSLIDSTTPHIENKSSIQESEENAIRSSDAQDTIATAEPLASALPAQLETYSQDLKAETIAANMGLIKIEYLTTDNPIKTSGQLQIPIRIINTGNQTLITETVQIFVNDTNRLMKKTFIKVRPNSSVKSKLYINIPEGFEEGVHELLVRPVFVNNRAIPEIASISILYSKSVLPLVYSRTAIISFFLIGLIIALIAAFLIVYLFKRITNQSMAKITSQTSNSEKTLHTTRLENEKEISTKSVTAYTQPETSATNISNNSFSTSKPLALIPQNNKLLDKELDIPDVEVKHQGKRIMLNLFVFDQNTAIGRRNIHLVKPGIRFSVGGGNSDFLIFLVPIPSKIGILQFDGESCTFFPRKPQFFPDTGEESIPNCIGKPINIISEKGYKMTIRFDLYEDPLKKLNSFLHSIETTIEKSN